MTFIEEIAPYIERIKLHQEGGRITSREILLEIRDIHFKYIRSKDFDKPEDIYCGGCVTHMMNQLVGKIDRDSKKKGLTSFDKKETIRDGKKMSFPKQERPKIVKDAEDILMSGKPDVKGDGLLNAIKSGSFVDGGDLLDTSLMKWGAFKKYCTSKGLKVKGKKRVQLEEELNNL